PERTDKKKMGELFRQYGGAVLAGKADKVAKGEGFMMEPLEDRTKGDDFAACGGSFAGELGRQFVGRFYFGCGGEGRMTAVAFDGRFNHVGAQLNAMFSSDLGHWDVSDMSEVLVHTHQLLDEGMLNPADFKKFVFGNAARMYTAMNPDFFKGTQVEDA